MSLKTIGIILEILILVYICNSIVLQTTVSAEVKVDRNNNGTIGGQFLWIFFPKVFLFSPLFGSRVSPISA